MPPFVSETEEVKLLFSGMYVFFEHTLMLHASFKLSCQKHPYGFVLCLCFPNKLTSGFLRKRRLMCFCFVSVGEEHNKYQQRKQNMQSSLPSSTNDEISSLQLFPGPSWRTWWARACFAPMLNFLAVCSSVLLGIHWKVNLNSLYNILASNLLDNKKWKTLRE